jgi:hypothetical protein
MSRHEVIVNPDGTVRFDPPLEDSHHQFFRPAIDPLCMSFQVESDDCEVQAIGIILQVLKRLALCQVEPSTIPGAASIYSRKDSATRILDFVKSKVDSGSF